MLTPLRSELLENGIGMPSRFQGMFDMLEGTVAEGLQLQQLMFSDHDGDGIVEVMQELTDGQRLLSLLSFLLTECETSMTETAIQNHSGMGFPTGIHKHRKKSEFKRRIVQRAAGRTDHNATVGPMLSQLFQ